MRSRNPNPSTRYSPLSKQPATTWTISIAIQDRWRRTTIFKSMSIELASSTSRWLSIAEEIADHLCQSAYRYGGECTWMGTVQHGSATFSYETLGADLYGGASGIALFLVEVYARTANARLAEVAREALRFSAARLDRIPHRFRVGFYSGRVGVAFALARGGDLLEDAILVEEANRELQRRVSDDNDDILLD